MNRTPLSVPSSGRRPARLLASAVLGALVLSGCATLSPAPSHDPAPAGHSRLAAAKRAGNHTRVKGDIDVIVGAGFTAGPGTSLLGGQADYYLNEDYAVGPLVQLGVSSDDTLFASSINVTRIFDTQQLGDYEWRPFALAGVGIAYMDRDLRVGSVDDTGLLLNVGGGAEVYINDDLTLRSTLMINFLPDKVLGERSFFSWQILQVQFRF